MLIRNYSIHDLSNVNINIGEEGNIYEEGKRKKEKGRVSGGEKGRKGTGQANGRKEIIFSVIIDFQ